MSVWKHEIYCNTESVWVEGYGPSAPTVCYNDNAHSVGSVRSNLQEWSQQTVVLNKTVVKLGQVPVIGDMRRLFTIRLRDDDNDPADFSLAANTTSFMTWTSPPYPIYIMDMYAFTASDNKGDCINLYVNKLQYPGAVAGDITADVSASSTVIPVHAGIVSLLYTGMEVTLDDGTNSDNLGEIIDVDSGGAKIKVSVATTNSFLASTPTKVLLSAHAIKDMWIGNPGEVNLGKYFDSASRLEPNTVISVSYQNTSATQATDLTVYMAVKMGSQNINPPL